MAFKKSLFVLFSVLSVLFATAQSTKPMLQKHSLSFRSMALVGLLEGEQGSSFQMQSINGFQHKNLFAGIGVGFDYYFVRSIPLFIDVRKNNFLKTPLFLYADAGMHMPWVNEKVSTGWYDSEFKNGLYYNAGLGYAFKVSAKNAILLSLGYSQKQTTEVRKEFYIWAPPYENENVSKFDYRLRRISITTGFKF